MADIIRSMIIKADGVRVCNGCRMHLAGKTTMTLRPDVWQLDIYNLPAEDESMIRQAKEISVFASNGYDSVFSAKPIDIIKRTDASKDIKTLIFMPGESFWRSSVNIGILSGHTAKMAVEAVLKQTSASLASHIDIDTKSMRGAAYFGRAADVIDDIMRSSSMKAWSCGDDIYCTKKGSGETAITLSETDYTGKPGSMENTVIVDVSFRAVPVGRMAVASGAMYRIVAVTISADTDTGDWYTELTLLNENAITVNEWVGLTA